MGGGGERERRSRVTFEIDKYLAQSEINFLTIYFCNINNYTSCTTEKHGWLAAGAEVTSSVK